LPILASPPLSPDRPTGQRVRRRHRAVGVRAIVKVNWQLALTGRPRGDVRIGACIIARWDWDGGIHLRFGHSDLEPLVEGSVDDHLALGKKRGEAGRGEQHAKDEEQRRDPQTQRLHDATSHVLGETPCWREKGTAYLLLAPRPPSRYHSPHAANPSCLTRWLLLPRPQPGRQPPHHLPQGRRLRRL